MWVLELLKNVYSFLELRLLLYCNLEQLDNLQNLRLILRNNIITLS